MRGGGSGGGGGGWGEGAQIYVEIDHSWYNLTNSIKLSVMHGLFNIVYNIAINSTV